MSTSNGVIPNGHSRREDSRDSVNFRVSGFLIVVVTLSLPLLGFLVCVAISMMRDFEDATYATCNDLSVGKVRNFLPSISASIGSFTPQRYVWRVCFSLHLTPRLLYNVIHYHYNMGFPVSKHRVWYRRLNCLGSLMHFGEIIGLILLTYVSSAENFPIHEKGFMMFVLFAQLYMICILVLFWWARRELTWTPKDHQSFRLKIVFFAITLACTGLTYYFFTRHMLYCEPNVYSWFAVFEYVLVLANCGFHATWMAMDCGESIMKLSIPIRPGQYSNLSV